jgi:hypothetical protein
VTLGFQLIVGLKPNILCYRNLLLGRNDNPLYVAMAFDALETWSNKASTPDVSKGVGGGVLAEEMHSWQFRRRGSSSCCFEGETT